MRKRQSVLDGLTVVCSLEHNKSITWTCHLFTTHDDVDQNNHSMIWSYQSPRGAWPSCTFPRCRCFMRLAAWVEQTTRIGLLSKWAIKYWCCADDQLCNLWPRGWHQFPRQPLAITASLSQAPAGVSWRMPLDPRAPWPPPAPVLVVSPATVSAAPSVCAHTAAP